MTWYTDFRQEWIGEMLAIYGHINRCHIRRKFGVSDQQASADLQAFQKANPGAMTYDMSRKTYVATGSVERQGGSNDGQA